jgi:hypothetical protein
MRNANPREPAPNAMAIFAAVLLVSAARIGLTASCGVILPEVARFPKVEIQTYEGASACLFGVDACRLDVDIVTGDPISREGKARSLERAYYGRAARSWCS